MTMTIDNQQRHHLSSMGFDHMPYSGAPQFSNPWTTSGSSSFSSSLGGSSLPYDSLSKQPPSARTSTTSMSYSPLPASAPSVAGAAYSSVPYSQAELLNPPADPRSGYEQAYTSAPSQTTSYVAAPATYAPISSYGQSLAQQQQEQSSRRLSSTSGAASLPQSQVAFVDAIDGARGMVAMSQTDITPRNIYGPRGDRGSTDGYGFPSTHSSHSSISSASTYPSYFGGSADSATDYSSASESVDSMNSRTLPRPTGLLGATLPPAPQSMMSSFNSKIPSSTQKKHKCKICDKRFTRPSSLQTHMYSHTGEKPYACEVPGCGRNFSVVSNLRRHKKVHKGDRSTDDQDHGSPEGSWASHD